MKSHTKSQKFNTPVFVLLNLLIAGLIIVGLYLILQPYFLHLRQDRKTSELIKSLEVGDGSIVLSQDDLQIPGEEEDAELNENLNDPLPETNNTNPVVPAESAAAPAAPADNQVVTAIGEIVISKIKLRMPIADRAESVQLRVAIGLLGGSAFPGTPGNTILLGHRMYTYGRHFNRLKEVVAGDSIVITTKDRRLTYTVVRQEIILPSALRSTLSKTTTENQLILVTCHPVKVASHRLLVYAKQISDNPL